MRAASLAGAVAVLLAAGTARADGDQAPGFRISVGGGTALAPAFVAVTIGADIRLRRRLMIGVLGAGTVPQAGDRSAVEDQVGFASLLLRYRVEVGPRLRLELAAGGGGSLVRFGSPGAHTETAPDVAAGAAIGRALGQHGEIAIEAVTHATFGQRAATRDVPHVSAIVGLVLRLGK